MHKKIRTVINNYILKKDRFSFFFIINAVLGLLVIILLFFKFKTFWLVMIFSFIIFYVRWKRQTMGIHLTLEPIILFSVIMLKLAGLKYALIVATIPSLLSDLVSGRLRSGTFISVLCKILVLVSINLFSGNNLILVTMVSYIVFNELVGTALAFLASANMEEVIVQVLTSTMIRLVYLNLFLHPLCLLVGAGC
ncbi:MAG: hypothetical protein KKF44_06835 [Nanoarchaeota archaeon]|nr:hypothetical protein [Nanoarchaeota archaeon]